MYVCDQAETEETEAGIGLDGNLSFGISDLGLRTAGNECWGPTVRNPQSPIRNPTGVSRVKKVRGRRARSQSAPTACGVAGVKLVVADFGIKIADCVKRVFKPTVRPPRQRIQDGRRGNPQSATLPVPFPLASRLCPARRLPPLRRSFSSLHRRLASPCRSLSTLNRWLFRSDAPELA